MNPTPRPLEYAYHSSRPLKTMFYLLNRRWYHYLAIAVLFGFKYLPVCLLPVFITEIINTFTESDGQVDRLPLWFGLMALSVFQNIFSHTAYIYLLGKAVREMENRIRGAVAERLQHLSIPFHSRTESGRLQAKVLRDAEQIQTLCMMLGEIGMSIIVGFLFAVILTAIRAPQLLLFYLLMVPVSVGITALFRRRINRQNTSYRSELEQMSSETVEMLNMIPIARAHGLEDTAISRSRSTFSAVSREGLKLDFINAFFGSSSWAAFHLSLIVALAVLSWLCTKGRISAGEIILFQSLFAMLVTAVSQLLGMIPQIAKGMESIRSIGEVLECPDIEQDTGRKALTALDGRVEFDQVHFTYENSDHHSVSEFSLPVSAGECIALVGASGAGKSTLIQLLIGFLRPSAGRILFDGTDMAELDMRTVRRFISVVPQETVLFSGSIRENITYGLNKVSDRKLNEVLAAANLTAFIEELPEGLESRIGEDGARLSGGQRQRIAIARALIRNPKILILDEATSALDVVSEKLVQEAIDRAVQNRTTFIVAHRLSTIRQADRIVVMQDGRIAETGTYQELLDRRGLFYEMQQLQH
ncbi:ABC transporter ATP-binding protein [Pontiella agarivorans]|uniref:ABC transporter ATP-binding protein n=1 Tax=Pontiella agarivorans TaxID=3038953 RepID=A0ABU5MWS2_9BACT|nr:ABC transporter ATP-binding protein [Pontiella agarivorans]MDZ8118674.1 ABC transporter ATP-binding protein [Pontiella agarivorans]